MPVGTYIDVHQHLWPAEFLEQLRRRTAAPRLVGWMLHTAGEPPYPVRSIDHCPDARRGLDPDAHRILLSLSAPLGIEALPSQEAQPLLDSWHRGALALAEPFGGWASVHRDEPDIDGLKDLLVAGLCGLQVPATDLLTPSALERIAPVLQRCAELDRPVLVHPGPVRPGEPGRPDWWPAVVDYAVQLQAAWWTWQHAGRRLLPDLRICFVAGAGLAPLHHERFSARGGHRLVVDRNVFLEISSYGRQAIDALIRALGIDGLVLGSDRPYAMPYAMADAVPNYGPYADPHLGAAAHRAIRLDNPTRLLEGDRS